MTSEKVSLTATAHTAPARKGLGRHKSPASAAAMVISHPHHRSDPGCGRTVNGYSLGYGEDIRGSNGCMDAHHSDFGGSDTGRDAFGGGSSARNCDDGGGKNGISTGDVLPSGLLRTPIATALPTPTHAIHTLPAAVSRLHKVRSSSPVRLNLHTASSPRINEAPEEQLRAHSLPLELNGNLSNGHGFEMSLPSGRHGFHKLNGGGAGGGGGLKPVLESERLRPVALEEELQMRVGELSARLRAWQKRAHQYKDQCSSLAAQLQRTRAESADRLHSVQNDHLALMQRVRTEQSEACAAHAQLERDFKALQAAFKTSLEQNKADIEGWQRRLQKRSDESETLRAHARRMRDDLGTLQEKLDSVQQTNKELQERNAALEKELEYLKSEKTNDNSSSSTSQLSDSCACMSIDYKMLYELSLLKLKSLERRILPRTPKLVQKFNDNRHELLDAIFDLARQAGSAVDPVPVDVYASAESLASSSASSLSPKLPTPRLGSLFTRLSDDSLPSSPRLPFTRQNAVRTYSASGHPRVHELISSGGDDDFRQRSVSELPAGYRSGRDLKPRRSQSPHEIRALSRSADNAMHLLRSSHDDLRSLATVGGDEPHEVFKRKRSGSQHQGRSFEKNDGSSSPTNGSATSGFDALRTRRNGITAMPMDVAVALRLQDVKKSKEFAHLLSRFHSTSARDKQQHGKHSREQSPEPEGRFSSAIRRLSRKKKHGSKEKD